MSIALALATLLASAQPHPATFAARVAQARQLEAGTAGTAYQKALWGRIGNATTDVYKSCLASNAPADKRPFTLVAGVDADGTPRQLAVTPATPVATCMAGQFARWKLPTPPTQPKPYPIEIDFSIAPATH
ncbi:peptidase C13 [Dyella sp. A6]|uniref:peptidase C13 n=1 Tax=Dyella aluminiiresistens TaxID=3069105 RepID=UPI002E78E6A2|nr:peptidase C13 [Dyella sp. A6]